MHSTDKQLLRLLVDNETWAGVQAIEQHVETCAECQSRLYRLAGAGPWTNEVVAQLRTSGSVGLEQTDSLPLTIVDEWASDSGNAEIETDSIRLDFLAAPTHPELLGRLGRYEVERVIGMGGMGIVLKGYDGELHRAVAIKVLAPHLAHSAAARRRFAREAQATAAVIHPNVIPIHNVECEGKVPYLVMRFINGQSLQARVDQQGPLAVIDALRIAQQTAGGLAAAHAQGLIHRDVKPANILLDEGIERVVLSDFGLARTVDDASLTHTGIVTGTPHYMSPEQAGGDAIDCRSDLFSLGCVLWFMLTGRPPFRAATAMGVLNRICHDTHHDIRQINSSVPVPLARIIDRLLAKRPEERPVSAQTLEHELLEVTRGLQTGQLSVRAENCGVLTARWKWARPAATAAACLVVAMLIVAGLFSSGLVPSSTLEAPNANAQSNSVRSAVQPGQQPMYVESAGNRTTVGGDNRPAEASYSLPALDRGDRWHQLADSLHQDLMTLDQPEQSVLQWLERLHQRDSYHVERLAGELDVLMLEMSLLKQGEMAIFAGQTVGNEDSSQP